MLTKNCWHFMRNTLHDVSVLQIGLHTAITISGSFRWPSEVWKIPVYLVTWPYADDDLRADSINVIEENNDVTKVNSIHLIRLIARQLSDEFLSVFVLDINGLVSLFLSTAEIMNFLDMWKIWVTSLVRRRRQNVSVWRYNWPWKCIPACFETLSSIGINKFKIQAC